MTDRACRTCGSRMGPGEIRQRDPRSGELVCPTCLNHPMMTPNRTNVNIVTAARNILRKVAHDGGDGQVVRHCFSCGSGGVVGRSDGTVECSFCGEVFSVQVQPRNPHAPQTVNGQPVHIPGMPEESEVTPSTGDETVDAEVVDGPEEPSGEFRVPGIEDADLTDYMTATGHRLGRKHYVQHLALAMTPIQDRAKVQGVIREANLTEGGVAEVRWVDHRPNGTSRTISIHDSEDDAYDTAREVARGAALSFGIGGTSTEVPGSRFEIWRNGEHIADVVAALLRT